jgi:hypothetical protein
MLGFIVEIIGEEAAAKLIARFGGTRLYVPHSPCPDDALALAVGTGAAMKLAEMFGGERVELPKPPPRRMQDPDVARRRPQRRGNRART